MVFQILETTLEYCGHQVEKIEARTNGVVKKASIKPALFNREHAHTTTLLVALLTCQYTTSKPATFFGAQQRKSVGHCRNKTILSRGVNCCRKTYGRAQCFVDAIGEQRYVTVDPFVLKGAET